MTTTTLGMALGICDVCGKAKSDGQFVRQDGPLGAFSPLLAVAMGVCECPPQEECRTPVCDNPAEDGPYCHTCRKVVDDIRLDRGRGMDSVLFAPITIEP